MIFRQSRILTIYDLAFRLEFSALIYLITMTNLVLRPPPNPSFFRDGNSVTFPPPKHGGELTLSGPLFRSL